MKPAKMMNTSTDTIPKGVTTFSFGPTELRKKNHIPMARFITKSTNSKIKNSWNSDSKPHSQYTNDPKISVSTSAKGIWLADVASTYDEVRKKLAPRCL
ncbi:hypothetical protein PC116_g29645 [Phytophthora cactorum]|nr:hypothetical protein PC116_g29645 [Phytophthora cactorum]